MSQAPTNAPFPHAPIAASHSIDIDKPLEEAFHSVIFFDVPSIIQDHGPLPGAARVEPIKGTWREIGDSRRIILTNGSSVHEEIIKYDLNKHAAFRLSEYAAPLKQLVSQGSSVWDFEDLGDGKTRVQWTYSYIPRSAFTKPLVVLLMKTLWPGYMKAALARLKPVVEGA